MPRRGAARRYAEAAFQIASRDGSVDDWQRDLATAAAVAGDEHTSRAVDSPAVAFEHRRKAVERILGGRISGPALNLCLLLAERGRFALLAEIRRAYDDLVRASRHIVAVTVTSAAPLDDDEVRAVTARAEELAGGSVELHLATDASLIGGLTMRIGDRVIDASLRGRLERLRERLAYGTT